MNSDGTQPTNISRNAAQEAQPAWSPDGNRIAFWSNRDGSREIYVMNVDGTHQMRVTK